MKKKQLDESHKDPVAEVISFPDPLDDMVAISKNQLIPGSSSPADVFLRLPSGKLVLLLKLGSKVNIDELHAINSNQVDKLFVRKSEYNSVLGLTLQIAGLVVSHAELSEAKKLAFLGTTADGVFREIEGLGFDPTSLQHAKTVVNSLVTLVEAKSDMNHLIASMEAVSIDLVKHSLAVSAVSLMIADSLGWIIPQTNEKLALGAFLHDVGLKQIPEELHFKARHLMTLEEVKCYEEHVLRGAEILGSMPDLPDDVISISIQHHENSFGMGYPRKIKDMKIAPLAKVVALADAYCDLVLSHPGNLIPRTPDEAIRHIEISLGQPFNRQVFEALKACVTTGLKVGRVKVIG